MSENIKLKVMKIFNDWGYYAWPTQDLHTLANKNIIPNKNK